MTAFAEAVEGQLPDGVDVMVIPPTLYVADAVERLSAAGVMCGVQNVHAEIDGAFTGEIAADVLRQAEG